MKSLASILCFLVAANSIALFAQAQQPAQKVVTKFETLRGEVVDSRGNQIEKCCVAAWIYEQGSVDRLDDIVNSHRQWETKDAPGRFSFDVEKPISIKPTLRLTCRVTAAGYLPVIKEFSRHKDIANFDGNFGRITLKRTVKVRGRITMPASAKDEAPLLPRATFKTITQSKSQPLYQKGQFFEGGSFEVILPEDCQVKMLAYSQNAAAISKTVKIVKFAPESSGQDLGDIPLAKGVSVCGVVLTRDGSPVANQSVKLSQILEGQYIHASAVTDELGEFELAPRLGNVVVKLNDEAAEDGAAPNSAGRKLIASPVKLTLRQGEAVKPIEFREAESFLITGSVALENGRVPENVMVAVSNKQHGTSDQKRIGKDGTFAFAVARGLEVSLVIMYNGDNEGSFFVASLTADSLHENRDVLVDYKDDVQMFNFKPIEKHIGPLDFVLLKAIPEHTTAAEEALKWILGD